MRILQVAPPWLSVPPLRYGGVEWVVSGLADGLVDAGHEVTLVASGSSVTRAELEVVFSEPPFEQLGDARIETIQALAAYRRRNDFDIIHDHTAAVGPARPTCTSSQAAPASTSLVEPRNFGPIPGLRHARSPWHALSTSERFRLPEIAGEKGGYTSQGISTSSSGACC